MRMAVLAVPFLLVSFASGAAETGADRYRLEKTPDGYVRMDTQTGEMSLCTESQGGLVCRLAADERTAMQDEVERLEGALKALEDRMARVDALEQRVAKLENSLAAKFEDSLPTEEDLNRTIGFMERFFRSFMGIVKDFENDTAKPAEPPAPQSPPQADKT